MNEQLTKMDRNLALETVRVTEAAALAASRWMGRGDEKAADQAAVDAMHSIEQLGIKGTVQLEGERDEAPMLSARKLVWEMGPRLISPLTPGGTTPARRH